MAESCLVLVMMLVGMCILLLQMPSKKYILQHFLPLFSIVCKFSSCKVYEINCFEAKEFAQTIVNGKSSQYGTYGLMVGKVDKVLLHI